ncbi:hypothetical protein Tco_1223879 [Tanacetum coccineum]
MAEVEVPQTLKYRGGHLNAAHVLEVENFTNWKKSYFQDSPDYEEDTRSIHEYLNDLEEEYQERYLLGKSKRFFKKGTQRFSSAKATDQTECHKCGKKELRPTKDFEAKYNKVKAKLTLLSSSASASKASTVKNKEVKVLMALAEENDVVSKEITRNGEWVKISMRKVHTLLEKEDNDDTKPYLDYLYIDLNYVEEQRNNILSKHKNLVHELNACKEQLLCISEQIPSQKKRIMGVDQLTEDSSSSEQKGIVFVKSSADDTKVILLTESQRNTTDPSVAVIDSSATNYDSADESSVCTTPLLPLKKLDGAEPISGPKTIKSILRSISSFKAETLKCVIINEP